VNKIMTESFELLLNRENNLNQITDDSEKIRAASGKFKQGT